MFPWVYQDYTSQNIDLANKERYRNLAKPMGDLGERSRSEHYQAIYKELSKQKIMAPYHYGTHYSSAALVMQALLRLAPFTEANYELNGGKFDTPDRSFFSIEKGWKSALVNMQDVRELSPEFFYLPEFLINNEDLDFGTRADKFKVDHVDLPTWAQKDPYKFVYLMRVLLESQHVSNNIHAWVNLIFGCDQKGRAAISKQNVFMGETYESEALKKFATLKSATDINNLERQLYHFGVCPGLIFPKSHKIRGNKSEFLSDRIIGDQRGTPFLYDVLKLPDEAEYIISFNYFNYSKHLKILTSKKTVSIKLHSGGIDKNGNIGFKADCINAKQHSINFPKANVKMNKTLGNEYPRVFLPGCNVLIKAGYLDGTIRVLGIEGKEYDCHRHHTSTVVCLKMDANKEFMVAGTDLGDVSLWLVHDSDERFGIVFKAHLWPHTQRVIFVF